MSHQCWSCQEGRRFTLQIESLLQAPKLESITFAGINFCGFEKPDSTLLCISDQAQTDRLCSRQTVDVVAPKLTSCSGEARLKPFAVNRRPIGRFAAGAMGKCPEGPWNMRSTQLMIQAIAQAQPGLSTLEMFFDHANRHLESEE